MGAWGKARKFSFLACLNWTSNSEHFTHVGESIYPLSWTLSKKFWCRWCHDPRTTIPQHLGEGVWGIHV